MRIIRICSDLIARFFISLVFLSGAVNTILHWQETEGSLLNILGDWQANLGFFESLQDFFSFATGYVPVLLIVATLLQLFGSLSILVGVKEKLGASMLILFLIPVTIIMHQFWFVEGVMREVQMIHFLKNLAILGGLIMILLQESYSRSSYPSMKF